MKKLLIVFTFLIVATVARDAGSMFNSLLSDFSKVSEEDLQKCLQNGDTEAFEKAKTAGDRFVTCFSSVKDNVKSLVESLMSQDRARVEMKVRELCRLASTLNPVCHTKYMNDVRPCLSDRDVRALELHERVTAASSSHNCRNDGQDLAEIFRMDELMCIGEHVKGLEVCMRPLKSEMILEGNSALALPRSLLGKGCNIYKNMGPCITEQLPCKAFSDFLVGGINSSISILTPCPNEDINEVTEAPVAKATIAVVNNAIDDVQAEEIKILQHVQTLLQSIAETSKHQLDIEKSMDVRSQQMQNTEEKAFSDITSLMRKIMFRLHN